MSNESSAPGASAGTPDAARTIDAAALLEQYGCGQIPLSGSDNPLYERHLVFDNVVAPITRAGLLGCGGNVREQGIWRRGRDSNPR